MIKHHNGCSTGGMQALREAQQYPDDYDGIFVGSPGNNRARIHISLLWNYSVAKAKPSRRLTDEKLQLIQLFPGLPRGTELGWKSYMKDAANPEMPFAGIFRWVFGPDWQWNTFDYDRDATTFVEVLQPFFVATDPDLGRFKAKGGKLLMYYGWADWLSSAYDGIDYYDKVIAKMRPRGANDDAALRSTQQFFRFFMMPGVSHCSGGPGADRFDALGTLTNWVEKGTVPNRPIASNRATDGAVRFTRPLCAYPQVARYKGSGDIADAASYECKK